MIYDYLDSNNCLFEVNLFVNNKEVENFEQYVRQLNTETMELLFLSCQKSGNTKPDCDILNSDTIKYEDYSFNVNDTYEIKLNVFNREGEVVELSEYPNLMIGEFNFVDDIIRIKFDTVS